MPTSEELLHLFGPYVPTDRFRALLRGADLPIESHGATMLVDMTGFSELTIHLVAEFGAQRAAEELKRRLNPMFEAIAGQVFQHGGSVIRFAGDGFTAWFDDHPVGITAPAVSGTLRAVAAGREMQNVMRLWRDLRLKVCIASGVGRRYVVGLPAHGMVDVLAGPATEATISLVGEAQPGHITVHAEAIANLRRTEVSVELSETGNGVVLEVSDALANAARQHRWPAWHASATVDQIVDRLRPFLPPAIREAVERGFGHLVGELRHSLPVFIRFKLNIPPHGDEQAALDQYVTTAQQVLAENGGRLVSVELSDKGNVIFGVFGVHITYGDDAVRAITAALRMREIGGVLNTVASQRFAISRGLLYSGIIGGEVRHEYSTIGDETNIAARLMNLALDSQILVTSNVRKEARSRVIFHDLAPIAVKGRAEPIPISQPVGLRAHISRKMHIGLMVGREAEMSQFRRLVNAVAHGHPRLLRIEGHAGIGKSRLLVEAVRYAQHQDFKHYGGICANTGQHIPYFAWHDLLMALLKIVPDAEPEVKLRQLSDAISALDAGWLPRLPLLGDILRLTIPDTPLTASLERRTRSQAAKAFITDLILSMAAERPLLLSLEDTQWLDEVSESLTIELARRLMVEPAPVLLVLIHRSLDETDHPSMILRVISEMRIHHRMSIQELTRQEVYAIIERLLNTPVPPGLSTFVYERSQGNPFFVHEMLDTLIDTGLITTFSDHVQINGDLEKADLPQTVQGLIQARLDRLSEADKLVVKVAAVIGREFQVRVLREGMPIPMSPLEIEERLQVLQDRDFIHLNPVAKEPTFQFKHLITQEVAYQSIPFTQRQELHQAVAAALQGLLPDAVEALAHHFAQAGDSLGASRYLRAAGQKAFNDNALQAALSHFAQADKLAQVDADRAAILRDWLEVLLRVGDAAAMHEQITRLRRLAMQYGQPDWLATAHRYQAHVHLLNSAWLLALESAHEAVTAATAIGDELLIWDVLRLMRTCYRHLRLDADLKLLNDRIGEVITRLDDTRAAVAFLLMQVEDMIAAGFAEGSADTALIIAEYALEQAEALNDLVLEAEGYAMLGTLYQALEDLPSALLALRQQVNRLRQLGDRRSEGMALNRIGSVLISLGQFSEANHHLLDAYRLLRQMGERAGEAVSLVHLGVIAEHYRAIDEALAYLNRGLVIQKTLSAFVDSALTLFHMGNCYTTRGEYDDAKSAFVQARGFLRYQERVERIAEVELGLAEVAMRRGERDRALDGLQVHLPRLLARQVGGMLQPGLAYWRAVTILRTFADTSEDSATVIQVVGAFRTWLAASSDKLFDSAWRKAYVHIWYHTALNVIAASLMPADAPGDTASEG
jgi:predicted ATPase/class 3 adenylate cyclase